MFQKLHINDYSLLLGIHKISDKSEAQHIMKVSPDINRIIRNSFKFKQPQLLKTDHRESV